MRDYLAVGKIINTHGVRGEMKVFPLTSDLSRFDYLKLVWLEENDKLTEYFVEKVRYHKKFVLITLRGIHTMDRAAELKNCLLMIDRKHARPLEKDEYFITDLIDCLVYQDEILLGKVSDVLQPGGNDVYVTQSDKYGEILIPAVVSVIQKIDITQKKIWVTLPEGLVEQ